MFVVTGVVVDRVCVEWFTNPVLVAKVASYVSPGRHGRCIRQRHGGIRKRERP